MNRPNILLVSFDDAVAPWPYKTTFGEPLQTPNLDRLCAVSTAFHSAYAQAPICGPSRASFMTTMMPSELGILDNSTFVFDKVQPREVWSHRLKRGGYFCSSGGKVHHRYKPLNPAHHRALYSDARKVFSDDMRLPRELRLRAKGYGGLRNGRALPDGPDDAFFYDAQVADSAVSFLESFAGDQPFYREVGFFSPHTPHVTPARFKEMYNVSALQRPPEWDSFQQDNAYVAATVQERPELQSEDWWRKSVRNYFSAYSHGDHQLGRVLDALAASRHAANTVVIVVADHGFHLGSRNLFSKSTMWEQSLNVPLIIFDPQSPVGRVVNDPVALIDIGPTVLDFAGIAPGLRRHGQSLRPRLAGAVDDGRAIPSFFRRNASVRQGRHRLIRYGDGSYQLFDIDADVWQLHDLGTAHPEFARMHQVLHAVMADCGFDPTIEDAEAAAGLAGPDDDHGTDESDTAAAV
jgi:arylsulfatase A-like enzyme